MDTLFHDLLSPLQLSALSSIVQIGNATFEDLRKANEDIIQHPYMKNIRGRIKTNLVQMQAEIEHTDPQFPFRFNSRPLQFGQIIPELSTEKVILHLAHSNAPDALPSAAKYKYELSYNNHKIQRQLMIENYTSPPAMFAPIYGILVFGYDDSGNAVIQFPEPGYTGIADVIPVPKMVLVNSAVEKSRFERRKANLKAEYLRRIKNE